MKRIVTSCLLMLFGGFLSAQITLIVNPLPANTPQGTTLYVAGTFNNWDPGATAMTLLPQGNWTYTVPAGTGTLEFKFTRGSWATVEGSASGTFRPNRTHVYGNGDTLLLQVAGWEGLGGGSGSTANAQVQVYNPAFYMPQLGANRRIWIYLPLSYPDIHRHFPVLYMHDGQNLFDATTAAFGTEWRIDETLNSLEQAGDSGIIVVGIDNGPNRLDEYSPWVNAQYGGGDGEAYVDFIVQTLKPHIDSAFRTRPARQYTGVAGSSMGGLISLYAAVQHPDIFSRAGVLSPSLWFSDSVYQQVSAFSALPDSRVYLLAGGQEPASVANNNRRMTDSLLAAGYPISSIWNRVVADGQHSEWFWGREFADMYLKLFAANGPTSNDPSHRLDALRFYPNPGRDRLVLELPLATKVTLMDSAGRTLFTQRFEAGRHEVELPATPGGLYLLRFQAGESVRVEKWVRE